MVPDFLDLPVNRPMCEADLLPLTSSAEVKINLTYTFIPVVCLHVLDKNVFALEK